MTKYLQPTPVKVLEAWFVDQLKIALPDVHIILGPKTLEDSILVPSSHIRINYEGYYSSDTTTRTKEGFEFSISYYSTGVSNLNPHHPSLAMLETGRFGLWQKIPPAPADAYPLQLRSEKLLKVEKGCGCLAAYQQTWRALTEIAVVDTTYADPCQGASEPGSVLPPPPDSITPFNIDWYYCLNPDYDANQPESVGSNQPWLKTTVTGAWVVNPTFDPLLPIQWGNEPVILKQYVKDIQLQVQWTQN
jgi:hypothetical protein